MELELVEGYNLTKFSKLFPHHPAHRLAGQDCEDFYCRWAETVARIGSLFSHYLDVNARLMHTDECTAFQNIFV